MRGHPPRALFKPLLLGLAIVGVAACIGACRKPPNVSFDIDVPTDSSPVWVEVAAYPQGACSALLPQSQGGLPEAGFAARIAFNLGDSTRPSMGDLPKQQYAFVGVARDANCGVVSTGCANVDVSSSSSVEITFNDTQANPTLGTCSADAICQDAVCVTSPDATNPSLGAGCSLQLIGAGPLGIRILDPDTQSFADETIGSPSVSATSAGFVIAYREVAGGISPAQARITTMAIDPGGGSPGPVSSTIPRCANDDESDGTGLAYAGDVGLLAFSRHACPGASAGVDYLALDPSGGNADGYTAVPEDTVEFSYGHSVAATPTTGLYDVTFLQDGNAVFLQTKVTTDDTGKPVEQPTHVNLLTGGPYLESHVSASDKLLAFLTRTADGTTTGDAASSSDGGGAGSTLHLQVMPVTTTPSTFATQPSTDIPGDYGAVAASSTAVAVVTDGTDTPLQLYTYTSARTLIASTPISMLAPDPVVFADATFVENRLFIAAARPAAISLLTLASGADGGAELPEIVLADDPRVPDLRAFRDGHVVVAATTTRVMVVWTTATALTGSDPTGGYALFACAD